MQFFVRYFGASKDIDLVFRRYFLLQRAKALFVAGYLRYACAES
jgi:hypothetical protein